MTNKQINLLYTTIKIPLPNFIYKDLKKYSTEANLYYPQPEELIKKLSKKHKIPQEMIYLTAGIDEAIQITAKTYGKNAYVFTPTYVVYTDVEVFGGKLTRLNSIKNDKFIISTKKIPKASIIYLANPNNPSGITPIKKVEELIHNNPQAIVVIDEAYAQFSNLSVIEKTKQYKNLVVFRSFSKDYGMAGNRIGYLVASHKIIDKVKDKSQWCNVSYLSVGAAISALNHEKYFKEIRKGINKTREDFIKFLQKLNYTILQSNINAVLIKFSSTNKAAKFVKYLGANNIIVSHAGGQSNIGLDHTFVRIAIGNSQQMKTVKKVIANINLSLRH